MARRLVTVIDAHGRVVCERCAVADRPHTRLRGLMGRRALMPGDGLLLRPAPSIHTCFMRFPIDALFLDAQLRVLSVRHELAPWRFAGSRGARAVLELPAGEARALAVESGGTLSLAAGPVEGDDADPEIRRIDVGNGIYVRADRATESAEPQPPVAANARAWRVHHAAAGVAALLAALALLRLGLTPQALVAALVLAVLAVLSGIDLESRLLPNRIVLPATAVVLASQLALFPERWPEWLLAPLAAGALLLLPSLAKPGAIGMGDVKLAALLGAALGASVLTALTLGFLALVPAALLVLARKGRAAALPLGPFLAFGAAVVLLA